MSVRCSALVLYLLVCACGALVFTAAGCGTGPGPVDTGTVQGRVEDGGVPLEGVRVESESAHTRSNSEGDFLLEGVPVGSRYVFFSREDLVGTFKRVWVERGAVTLINPGGVVELTQLSESGLGEYVFLLYEEGLYKQALAEGEKFASSYPNSTAGPGVKFVQGASHYYLGNHSQAVDILIVMADAHPDNEFADDARYLAAKSLGEGLGDYTAAITQYRQLVNRYPQSPKAGPAYLEMADCYYILGSFYEASQIYEKALEYGGDVERKAIYSLAHCYSKMNQHERAAAQFALYVSRYPDTALSDDAQYFEGASYYQVGMYPEALAAFRRTVERYPQGTWYNGIPIAPAALFHQGLCLERMGRFLEAYDIYHAIIRDYPDAQWADGSSLIKSAQFRIDWLEANVL